MNTLGIKSNNVCRWTYDQFVTEVQGTDTDPNSLHGGEYQAQKSWTLGVGWEDSVKRATLGDNSLVVGASTLLDKLQINTGEVTAFKTVLGVSGGAVCVPAFLTNHPESMLGRQRRPHNTRQVNIYLNTTSSAGVSGDALLRRGTAVLALLEGLRMQQVAVDLFLVSTLDKYNNRNNGCEYSVIELPSRPLDLATVGFAVAHPAFTRNLVYGLHRKLGFAGGWATDSSVLGVRKALGLAPQDVYIDKVYGHEENITNPQAWLDKHMSQIIGSES
jgi:hypothetical protein